MKNTELVKRTKVEGTPFQIITTEEGSFVTLGIYRLSEAMQTESDAMNYIDSKNWHLILATVMVTVETEINKKDENYIAQKLEQHIKNKQNGKNEKN